MHIGGSDHGGGPTPYNTPYILAADRWRTGQGASRSPRPGAPGPRWQRIGPYIAPYIACWGASGASVTGAVRYNLWQSRRRTVKVGQGPASEDELSRTVSALGLTTSEGIDDMDLSRVVALANGKGGVGKTSLTANLAGEFAREGSRVLVVDLDISGNLKLDLGLAGHPADDAGQGIVQSIVDEAPLHIVRDVRPGVDWVPGGPKLNWLLPMAYGAGPGIPAGSVGEGWRAALSNAIEAGDYDMVLVDTPPGNRELQQMALTAARWILVPMKSDPASWDGLRVLGPLAAQARKDNPDLEWLGMVLFGHQSTATRIRQNVLDHLASDGEDAIPVLNTSIRASEKTAQECRLRGLLVRELVDRAAAADPSERFKALRARKHDPSVSIPESLPQSSTSMAGDYAELAAEVAARILESEKP